MQVLGLKLSVPLLELLEVKPSSQPELNERGIVGSQQMQWRSRQRYCRLGSSLMIIEIKLVQAACGFFTHVTWSLPGRPPTAQPPAYMLDILFSRTGPHE